MNYSRQREEIVHFLKTRKDHPTAEVVYENVRMVYPKISLGTVYRNLTLLSETGEILRLRLGDGVDHFDADTSEHYHVICNSCGSDLGHLSDLFLQGHFLEQFLYLCLDILVLRNRRSYLCGSVAGSQSENGRRQSNKSVLFHNYVSV